MADGTVTIKANFDGKDAESGVSRIKSALGGLKDSAGKIGSVFKSVLGANLVSSAITNGLSMVSSGISSIVSNLNESAGAWASFEGNMQNIGMSAGEIDKVRGSLQNYAKDTIYSASEMASTYAQLRATGVEGTEELVMALGNLAGSAENPAQAMKSLSQQVTQMTANSKVQFADFRILAQQAPAAMAEVAKKMGMTYGELTTAIKDGRVETTAFFDALKQAGAAGSVFEDMARKPKTVSQALDTLVDGISNKLLPKFQEFNQTGIDFIMGIADAIENINIDGIFKSFDNLTSGFRDLGVFDNFKATLSSIGDMFKSVFTFDPANMNTAVVTISNILNNLMFNIQDITAAISDFFAGFADSGAVTALTLAFFDLSEAGLDLSEKLSGAIPWETIGNAVGQVVKFIAEIVSVIAQFSQKVDGNIFRGLLIGIPAAIAGFKAFNFLKSFNPFSFFKKNAADGVGGAGEAVKRSKSTISQVFSGLSNVIKSSGTAIKTAATGIGKGISTAFRGIGTGVATAARGIGSALRMLNPAQMLAFGGAVAIAAVGIGAGVAIIAAGFALLATQSQGVSQIITAIGSAFSMVASTLIGAFAQAIVTVAGVLPIVAQSLAMLAPLVTAFGQAISMVIVAIGSVAPQFAILAVAIGSAVSSVVGAISGLVTAIAGGISQIITAVTPIVEIISTTFTTVVSIIANAIVQIVQALAPFIPAITDMVVQVAPHLASIAQAFSEMVAQISPIIDSLTQLLQTFGEQVSSILESAGSVVESFGSAIRNVLDGVAGIFESMGNAAKNAGEGVKLMAQGIKMLVDLKLGDLVGTLAAVAAGLVAIVASGIGTAGPGLQVAGTGLRLIATSAQMASATIQLLPTAFSTLSASLGTLPAMMTMAGTAMMAFATSAQGSVMSLMAIGATITQFATMMMTIGPASGMASAGLAMFNGQASSAGNAMQRLGSSAQSAQASVVSLGSGIVSSMAGATAAIASAGSQMSSAVRSAGTQMLTAMQSAMNQVTSSVRNGMTNSASAVRNGGSQMASALKSSGSQMVSTTQSFMNQITSTVRNGMNNIVSAVRNGGSQMVSAMRSAGTQLVTTVQSAVNQAANAARSGYGAFQSAGSYIGEGLAVGMRSALGAVIAAANELVAQANRAAQAKAKINSPSHLFRDEVGWWIGLGVAKGIDNSAPEVANSLDFIRDQVHGFSLKSQNLLTGATASMSSQLRLETLRGKTPKVEADARQEAYIAHSASLLSEVIDSLAELRDQVAQGQQMVLDTGALVGGTAHAYDNAIGTLQSLKGRHRL
ncbi:TPA: tape measure protein [Streptococcus suis]